MWCNRQSAASTSGLLVLAVLLLAREASADEPRFSVPRECSSEEEFLALVQQRLPPGVDQIPMFRAYVAGSGKPLAGELELDQSAPRQLVGASCVEILEAMAIILALRAERLHEEQLRASQPAAETPSAGWLPSTDQPSSPSVSEATPRELALSAPAATGPARDSEVVFTYRLGAGGIVLTDVAPTSALGPGLIAAIQVSGRTPWAVRLGVDRTATGSVEAPPASIWVRLSALRLSGCLFALGLGVARLQPCWQLAGGIYKAGGIPGGSITSVSEVRRPWFSLGPSLRAEIAWSSRLILAGEAAALVPLVNQELTFRTPDTTIYRSDRLSPYLGLTAEFRFGGSNRESPGMAL
jgi:hypothetical protein